MEAPRTPGRYRGPVQAVIFDWAGTTVDFGCMGPTAVFIRAFAECGVTVTRDEARRFMGVAKKDHIRAMCGQAPLQERWQRRHGRVPGEEEVERLYALTEALMLDVLRDHAKPIPGVLETVALLRGQNIRIGSTTGYTRPMMAVLAPVAKARGYAPDALSCSSDVPTGRPAPWMCFANAMELGIYPMQAMVKVGDTLSDIAEGLNAGMWTVGISRTGNAMGLGEEELAKLGQKTLSGRLQQVSREFFAAGAHYVLPAVADLPGVIETINQRLARGEHPLA